MDNDEYAQLMALSDKLKAEDDAEGGPWREHPATIRQLLAAGELDHSEADMLTDAELKEYCGEYTRGEVSDMLD